MGPVYTPSMRNVDEVLRALHSERNTFAAGNVMDQAAKTIRAQRRALSQSEQQCSECSGKGKITRYGVDYGSYDYQCPICGGEGTVGAPPILTPNTSVERYPAEKE